MVGAIHGPVEGDVPFDDVCAQRSSNRGNGNAAFVTGISHRHIIFAQLIHIAQIDIFKSGRVGAVAVQQGKLRLALLEISNRELHLVRPGHAGGQDEGFLLS